MSRRRVVIIDPAFLGDAVFNGPLIRALKRDGVDTIGLVVRPPADAIAAAIPDLDEIHVFDKYKRDRGLSGLSSTASELERAEYDLALIPHASIRSALLAWMAHIPSRVGAGGGLRGALFTSRQHPIEPRESFVDFRLRIGGYDALPVEDRALSAVLASLSQTEDAKRRVGLVLGSNYATKRWSPDNAAAFLTGLPPHSRIVLLGTEEERPLFDAIERSQPGALDEAEDHLGEDVASLIKTIAGLDVLVAGDTGPLHIARGLGVPVVALFGPTPVDRHTFAATDEVLTTGIECQPCGPHGHDRCPLGHHRCLTELSGEAVTRAVERVASTRRPK